MYTAICLMGPKARPILKAITDFDLSQKSFPFFTYREIDIGLVHGVRAMNLTHTGELGKHERFNLYIYKIYVNFVFYMLYFIYI